MSIVTQKKSAKTWRNTGYHGYGADITGMSHKTNNRDIAEGMGRGGGDQGLAEKCQRRTEGGGGGGLVTSIYRSSISTYQICEQTRT